MQCVFCGVGTKSLNIIEIKCQKLRIRSSEIQIFRGTNLKVRNLNQTNVYIFECYIRINLYNTLTLPVLLYGSENWTVKASDARRITAAEMK
jgi:hypothetical protein